MRYTNASGRQGGFNVRHLLNGLIDRYFYDTGLVDTTPPFAERHRKARINEAARKAEAAADFSERIRVSTPAARP